MRLLLVEDDPQLGPTLARGLRELSYAVDLVSDGRDAVYRAAINEYDIIVLDYMIPGMDGLAVAREIRSRGRSTPILVLTARDAIADRVAGLDAGADDYLVKPFAFEELLARLRALSRRAANVLPTVITVGELSLDTRGHRLTKRGREIPLTAKEYALLEFLARNVGAVVSRADITAHVWDDNHDPLSNNLEVFINRVRRRIDDEGAESYIKTRRGSGYLLAAVGAASGVVSGAARSPE
jgi:DNA-binding response OmpR family regulator